MVTQAVVTPPRKAGAAGTILVRGDSAYGNSFRRGPPACARKSNSRSWMAKNTAVARSHRFDCR